MSWLRSDQEVALNEIARTLRAAAERHAASAERVEDEGLRSLLRDLAARRQQFADELVRQSEAEAALPDADAEFFRDVVSKVKAALAGDADATIAAEALKDEENIRVEIDAALKLDLPDNVHRMLETIGARITHAQGALKR